MRLQLNEKFLSVDHFLCTVKVQSVCIGLTRRLCGQPIYHTLKTFREIGYL